MLPPERWPAREVPSVSETCAAEEELVVETGDDGEEGLVDMFGLEGIEGEELGGGVVVEVEVMLVPEVLKEEVGVGVLKEEEVGDCAPDGFETSDSGFLCVLECEPERFLPGKIEFTFFIYDTRIRGGGLKERSRQWGPLEASSFKPLLDLPI
jgi:hypothetical protein